MKITVEVAKVYNKWSDYRTINKVLMKKITRDILNKFENLKKVKNFEVSVLLTNDQEMLALNRQFRGKEKVTNILSFPDVELNWKHLLEFKPNLSYMYLGDVAFGYEIVSSQAASQNKTFEHHFIHLFVHGMLHMLGFDHQNDMDAVAMEKIEVEVLKNFGIPSPY